MESDETPSLEADAVAKAPPAKLTLLPLVALIFYEVSGGPFGVERAVSSGTPLLAILGFVVFPLIWSIPEALITAELGSAYPDDGGFVTWVTAAFGPFWGFQTGWWSWLSGVTDNAVYPVLFLSYITKQVPALEAGPLRWLFILGSVLCLTYLCYRGVAVVGKVAVLLCGFTLLPFICMAVVGIPQMDPSRLFVVDLDAVNWTVYLNCLFWNLVCLLPLSLPPFKHSALRIMHDVLPCHHLMTCTD
jgi:amino acid transporter